MRQRFKIDELRQEAEGLRRSGNRHHAELLEAVAAHLEESDKPKPQVDPPEPDRSAEIDKLAAALSAAQGQMTNAARDRENKYLQTTYATLASVLDACREALSSNGLSHVQQVAVSQDRESVRVVTTLFHASGQWIRAKMTVPIEQQRNREGEKAQTWIQACGAATTYARRYSLSALLGIAADDDDDGNEPEAAQPRQDSRPRRSALEETKEKLAKASERKGAEAKPQPKPAGPPVLKFGALELRGKPLSDFSVDDLGQFQETGAKQIHEAQEKAKKEKAAPPKWIPEVQANLVEIGEEIERRIAADKGGAPFTTTA